MRQIETTLPKLGFVIVTRAALAFGVGLLVSHRIPEHRRRILGGSLVAFGALTTIPALLAIFGRSRAEDEMATEEDGRPFRSREGVPVF